MFPVRVYTKSPPDENHPAGRVLCLDFIILCSDLVDSLHFLFLAGSVAVIGGSFGDLIHNVHTVDNAAESGVISVKEEGILVDDEELGSGGVRVGSAGHGENAAGVAEGVVNAVGLELSLYVPAGAAHSGALRVAALNHESLDDAVEDESVVKAALDKLFKVLTADGGVLGAKLQGDLLAVFHFDDYHVCNSVLSSWFFGSLPFVLLYNISLLKFKYKG